MLRLSLWRAVSDAVVGLFPKGQRHRAAMTIPTKLLFERALLQRFPIRGTDACLGSHYAGCRASGYPV
jgi:hypothetical protein